MDRRKKLLNYSEDITHAILQKVTHQYGTHVFPKVRVADVLNISRSGLNDAEYSYALSAHFDFVITNDEHFVDFAVEFDGPTHEDNSKVIGRDSLKNAICQKLGMSLLRIDNRFLKQIGHYNILEWLVELWYLHESFNEAQERGEIDYYESFCYFSFFEQGYIQDNRFVKIDTNTDDVDELVKSGKKIIWKSFNPFANAVAIRSKAIFAEGTCEGFKIYRADDNEGYSHSLVVWELPDTRFIVGQARCKTTLYPPISAWELAEEFANYDVALQFKKYRDGNGETLSLSQVSEVQDRLAKMPSFRFSGGTY